MKRKYWIALAALPLLLLVCLCGVTFGTMIFADICYERIEKGMSQSEVDAICRLSTKRETPLEQTAWMKNASLAKGQKIIVYHVVGFHPIEVAFDKNDRVVFSLPAFE